MHNLSASLLPIDAYWCIHEGWANNALAALEVIDSATHVAAYQALIEARKRESDDEDTSTAKPYEMVGSMAVLSITGPMMKQESSWGTSTSTVRLRRMIRQATADKDVKSIALVIDSPGGSVSGTADLAADVARANAIKPVAAYIEDMGCSAAYWVASQAALVFANQTALIGSIGTVMSLVDMSRAAENAGYKIHVISTGAHKGAGTRGSTVTPEQLAQFQREVDSINDQFLASVCAGREMSLDTLSELADGRVWIGAEAADLNLIDGIASYDAFLSQLDQLASERSRPAARTRGNEEKPAMASLRERASAFLAGLRSGAHTMSEEDRIALAAAEAAVSDGTEADTIPTANTEAERYRVEAEKLRADMDAAREREFTMLAESACREFVIGAQMFPAEASEFKALMLQALRDDYANPTAADASSRAEQLKAFVGKRPTHGLTEEVVKDTDLAILHGKETTRQAGQAGKPDPERVKAMLKATHEGRKALEERRDK